MKRYILCMIILLVPGSFLWSMTVDKEEKRMTSSLVKAIYYGASEEKVQLLLQNGVDINGVDYIWNSTPLDMAVAQGNEEVAAFLVSQGADVNKSYLASEPLLIRAAKHGKLSFVMFLVAHGVRINAIDFGGRTALMHAVRESHKDIVAFLLLQADLDICYRCINKGNSLWGDVCDNKTALDIAPLWNRPATAHMIRNKIDLIKKKILWSCSLRPPEGLSQQEQGEWLERLKFKIKRRILQIHTIDIADENGNTPLHKAVIAGNSALAFWILSIQPSLILRENTLILRKNTSEEGVSDYTPLHCDVGRRGMYAEFTRKFIEGYKEEIQKRLEEQEKKKRAEDLNG